jgi:histidyl-tRNA synthetase
MQSQALPGFRDFYPAEAALRNHIFTAWRTVARRYGFEEYDGPPLEQLKLYTDKSGDEIVAQLYNFEDKGGREVALRPEMTPTLARMVAARAQGLKKPIRWFSIPQLFRYERQQRGRLREHFQLNVDLIGEASPLADAEVIAVSIDVLRELGLTKDDFKVRLSDRNVMKSLVLGAGVPEGLLGAAFAACDKMDRDPNEVLLERMVSSGISEEAAVCVLKVAGISSVAALRDELVDASVANQLFECVDALHAMGLAEFVEIDCSIVRGLAYYTGIVFELFDTGRSLRAICGGGRYDNLTRDIGGVDLPALGFGMGDVVLGELLKDRGLLPDTFLAPSVYAIAVSEDDVPEMLSLAHELRDQGLTVEYALKVRSVGKQMKLAASRNARVVTVIGADERK